MDSFKELLDAPLPSKEDDLDDVFGESTEDDDIFTDDELDEFFGESEEDDEEDEFEESEEDEDFDDIFGESEDDYDDYEESDDDFEESDDEEEEPDDIGEAEEGTDPDEEDDSDDSYADEGCDGECEEGFDEFDDDEIANEIEDIMDDDPDYPDDDELDDDDLDLDDIPEEKPEPLTGEEDKKADDMMTIAATPLLIKDELTAESAAEFYESEDGEIAIAEGLILESDMEDLFQEGVFASPNKPFKMTKKARFNQLYEISVQIEGRLRNDPYYAKLQKAYAVERICKRELRKKYHQFAVKRAKVYLQRLIKSKSGTLAKIGKKIGLKK